MQRPILSVKQRKLGYKFLAAEAWWIITGKNDVASIKKYSPHIASFSNDGRHFDGAYGPRIVDQIRYVVDSLERDVDTRQSVASIWRPNPRDSKDVPCTISVQWVIRDAKLHCIDTMRSSDAWLGWPYDVFNFSMLSAYVLLLLRERSKFFEEIQLGNLWLTAGSSHLYVDPKSDGNSHVPYSILDVEGVLREPYIVEYQPLEIDDFSSVDDLIEYLSACKDNLQESGFMKDFKK
jgi:thymidylate synthase